MVAMIFVRRGIDPASRQGRESSVLCP